MTALLTDRFNAALVYAAGAHRDQTRKGTQIPYLSHLLTVAAIVLEEGGDEDEAVAALLHDVVEDAGGKDRLAHVKEMFGPRVAKIVNGCTDTDIEPKPPWKERKEQYIKHLKNEDDPSVLLVSAADKLANVRSILADYRQLGEGLWPRFNGGRGGSLWYYRTLAEIFDQKRSSRLTRELKRCVCDLEALAQSNAGNV